MPKGSSRALSMIAFTSWALKPVAKRKAFSNPSSRRLLFFRPDFFGDGGFVGSPCGCSEPFGIFIVESQYPELGLLTPTGSPYFLSLTGRHIGAPRTDGSPAASSTWT